jgi:hypothetical protein
MTVRSDLAAALMIATMLLGACARQTKTTTAVPQPRPHTTFAIASAAPAGFSAVVRDLFTQEIFTLEDRGGVLVLRIADGVIDTLSTPAALARSAHVVESLDSSFVRVADARDAVHDDSAHPHASDLVCVADGRLHWAAHLPSTTRIPDTARAPSYTTTYRLLRSPLSLTGDELYSDALGPEGANARWRRPFELRFDDSAHVFYNSQVELDSVPVEGESRAITGRAPAIALRLGTAVFVDGRWYALSLPQDLDPEDFARGAVGLVLEGRREWGDTLWQVR